MSTQLQFIDLFCGIGSFHYSLRKLGLECNMACDISQAARDTYQANYNIEPKQNIIDIDPKDIQKFDILCAGFPCQPWSNIGQHKGFNDERGTLFFQIMKFVSYHNPVIIILENVAALLRHNKGATFKRMTDTLREHQYQVASKILKCDDYGIPQMRKRLFILAIREDIVNNLSLDMTTLLSFPKQATPSLSEYLGKDFEKKLLTLLDVVVETHHYMINITGTVTL
jgi:DNA (cytosine-5)-methyltransferase 1